MADPNKTYNLPAALVAALMTNRHEFITLYAESLKSGQESLTVEGQVEMLTLIVDLLQDREEARSRAEQLEQRLTATISNIKGSLSSLEITLKNTQEKD